MRRSGDEEEDGVSLLSEDEERAVNSSSTSSSLPPSATPAPPKTSSRLSTFLRTHPFLSFYLLILHLVTLSLPVYWLVHYYFGATYLTEDDYPPLNWSSCPHSLAPPSFNSSRVLIVTVDDRPLPPFPGRPFPPDMYPYYCSPITFVNSTHSTTTTTTFVSPPHPYPAPPPGPSSPSSSTHSRGPNTTTS